jgi:hypothetical protein
VSSGARRRFAAGLLTFGVLGEAAAHAEPPGSASTTREAAAQALFDDAKRLLSEHHIDEACRKFEVSQEMDPGAGTELNLADCYQQAGQLARAWVTFKSAGADARRSARPEWGVIADKRAEKLAPLVPRVIVHVAPQQGGESAAISIDGQAIAPDAVGASIPLDPGDHRFVATIAGRTPFEQSVSLASGQTATVEVPPLGPSSANGHEDPAASRPEPPPPLTSTAKWERIGGIAAATGGVAGIGVGIYFGVDYLVKRGQSNGMCPQNKCSAQGLDLTNEARADLGPEAVAFTVGGVLGVGAFALIFLSTRHAPPAVTPTAMVTREGWNVGLGGSF